MKRSEESEDERAIRIRYGNNLRAERERVGITQARLAALAELHHPVIRELEAGKRGAHYDTQVRIAGVLNILPGALLDGIGWDPATQEFWTTD